MVQQDQFSQRQKTAWLINDVRLDYGLALYKE